MFFRFPYTDMYTVNLDWIITKIKEFENFVGQSGSLVFTVNGRDGNVIITKEEITSIVGGIVNSINGKNGDVVMSPEDIRALVGDYVVRFNNRVGDVTLRADDITATRINVVWVSDSGDVIEDLTPEDLAEMYNSGKRILLFYNSVGIPDRVYFLTLENDIPTPILYSPAELDTGVVSVNGLTGIVSIYSTDIKMTSEAGSRTIAQEVEALKQRDILHSEAILALQGDVSDLENVFTGATETTSGAKGLVPAPTNTQTQQFLKATGNFETVSAGEVASAAVSGAATVEEALSYFKSHEIATTITEKQITIRNPTIPASTHYIISEFQLPSDGDMYLVSVYFILERVSNTSSRVIITASGHVFYDETLNTALYRTAYTYVTTSKTIQVKLYLSNSSDISRIDVIYNYVKLR